MKIYRHFVELAIFQRTCEYIYKILALKVSWNSQENTCGKVLFTELSADDLPHFLRYYMFTCPENTYIVRDTYQNLKELLKLNCGELFPQPHPFEIYRPIVIEFFLRKSIFFYSNLLLLFSVGFHLPSEWLTTQLWQQQPKSEKPIKTIFTRQIVTQRSWNNQQKIHNNTL